MVRSSESESIHKNLIVAMVKLFVDKGYTVKADHISYEGGIPDDYGGKRPDIYAIKNDKEKFFLEAETCDSISSQESKEQWQVFSSKIDVKFWMIVPKECLKELKEKLDEWKITVDSIYTL